MKHNSLKHRSSTGVRCADNCLLITLTDSTITASGNPTITANAAGIATTATVAGLISGVVYSCSVVATNSAGASVASNAIAVTPTSSAPSIAINAPANNAIINGTVTFNLTAIALVGVLTKVDMYDATTLIGTINIGGGTSLTFDYVWTTPSAGSHSITAKVTDSTSQTVTSSPLTITVRAKPGVSLDSIGNFYLAPAAIDLYSSATANTTPGVAGTPTITGVEIYNGTTLITTLASPPYNFRWSNVAAGIYSLTAKATDSNGVTAVTAPIIITVGTASAISITPSPSLNGSATAEDNAYVGGSFQAPPNSAVTINGQLAITTPGGQFFINHLQLQPGSNIITLTVTAPDGQTATQTISITRNVPAPPPPNTTGPPIFAVTVEQGGTLTPNTTLAVPVTIAIINGGALATGTTADLSCKDPLPAATVSLSASSTAIACAYDAAGLYTVKVTIKNAANAILYTTTRQVKVESALEKIRTARSVYVDLIDRLMANNKAGALNLFFGHAVAKYIVIFDALGTDLPALAGQLGTLVSVTSSDGAAEILVSRTVGAEERIFTIYLLRGEDGVWRIESM